MQNRKHEESYENIQIPAQLSQAVHEGLEKGKKIQRTQRRKRIGITLGSLAAVFCLFVSYCFANPTFAAELPLIGRIFAKTEQKAYYPGDYSKRAVILEENLQENKQTGEKSQTSGDGENQSTDGEETQISEYSDTDQNITITPKEVFFDGSSLYIGFQLVTQDEEGFGHEILKIREDGSQLDYSMIQMDGTWSDGSEEHVFSELLIGEQTAHDTFEGRIKIATENTDKNVKGIQMHITLLFWTDYDKLEEAKRQGTPEEEVKFHIVKTGDWNLQIPVKVDDSQIKTFHVNETNAQGFGIESIMVTPYEIQIVPIVPELNSDMLNQVYSGFKNLCVEQLGEEGADTFLAETLFDSTDLHWYGGFAVFNQDGERMEFGNMQDTMEIHQGEMKKMDKLYFYLMPDDVTAYKCQDQSVAEKCNIFSFVLEM